MRRLDRTRSYAFVAALFVVALFIAVASPGFADDGASLATDGASLEASAEADVATESGSTEVLEDSAESAANVQPAVEQSAPLLEVTGLNVQAHVQGKGWLTAVGQGATAGTTGQSRRLEALKLTLSLSDGATKQQIAEAVSVQAHVSGIGWQSVAAKNGKVSGTTGQSRSIEALRMTLSRELSDRYSIWYRVHSAEFGWLDWACDGADAGSAGYGKPAQAVQVVVLKKGSSAPGATSNPFRDRSDEPASVSVRAHVSNIGWMGTVSDGKVAGTTGRGLSLEALNCSLNWFGHNGGIQLRGHVSNIGWQSWSNGLCGTTGKSKALEAVQMRLTGDAASAYDIWYSVHSADYGWLGWAKNGEPAGTAGKNKAAQAVKVVLVSKGGAAPGPVAGAFLGDADKLRISSNGLDGKAVGSKTGMDVVIGSKGGCLLNSVSLVAAGVTEGGSVDYRVLGLGSGWSKSWASSGSVASGGAGVPVKAVQIKLSGTLASKYDVWYRVCDSTSGWTGWASNGASAGKAHGASGLSAVQVKLLKKGASAPGSSKGAFDDSFGGPTVVAQAHVANAGWLIPVKGGDVVGQTGKSRSLQALRVGVEGISGSVEVSSHVADIGWQGYVSGASFSGTVGRSKAIQAVKLRLTGDAAQQYDIYYRVHVANYGWLGWAKNDAVAGTTGLSKQAEAIQVKLVKRGGSDAPASNIPAYVAVPPLSVSVDCFGIGWQSAVGNGAVAGTTGQNRALGALKASVSSQMNGDIVYSAHVSNVGWMPEVSDGQLAGSTQNGQSVQAIKVRLTGNLSTYFDVWYRVHISNYGWLGWTRNGSAAGTTKLSIPVQAIQILIKPKGSSAPGSTSGSYFDTPHYIGYQTPGRYPKVSCNTVKLPSYCKGYFTYVTPSRIRYNATRRDCINAFVQRAYEYKGTRYIEPWSSRPGDAVDCSGLVLQCLYATGMDMGWYNPYNHRWLPEQTYNSTNWYRNNTFMPVSTSKMQRGDVVYYRGHIGIYIGGGQIIDSWPGIGVTQRSVYAPGRPIGAGRPFP